jgi:hypothetical protein
MSATAIAITEDRSTRTAAYREVQRIVAEFGGVKLHAAEAEVLEWAAEDLLLASSREDAHVATAELAFETLMTSLEVDRWAVGTDEQPTASTLLRRAFSACAPAA